MAGRKKRGHAEEEHANSERWLVSYADFITLLFAFFVVMFSAAHIDKRKVGRLSRSIQEAFVRFGMTADPNEAQYIDLGQFPTYSQAIETLVRGRSKDNYGQENVGGKKGGVSTNETLRRALGPGAQEKGQGYGWLNEQDLRQLRDKIEGQLKADKMEGKIRTKIDERGLTISLAEAAFFDSGRAEVKPKSKELLEKISQMLANVHNSIRVEGHTDNKPIHTARFPSNWELSTARATYVIGYLSKNYNIPAQQLSAAGYGEFHPVTTNDTEEGRAINRRVDLVILSQTTARREEPMSEAEKAKMNNVHEPPAAIDEKNVEKQKDETGGKIDEKPEVKPEEKKEEKIIEPIVPRHLSPLEKAIQIDRPGAKRQKNKK